MAFKKASSSTIVPDSPEKLFLDLPRRKIPDVMPHQNKIMRTYVNEAVGETDVALQLPTGSGKTLVGLLIGEWRRRKNQERVVYLCPTRQLVNQVVEQAQEKYGLTVLSFTGRIKDYDPADKAKYHNADHIAVTTYSSLFNTNPFFNNADILIVDDAHAAENYVASLWNVEIDRNKVEFQALHTALSGVIKPLITTINFARLSGKIESLSDASWVDKIPTPEFKKIQDAIAEVLDTHTRKTSLEHSWSMIRENLHGCHLYISANQILIRPLIPPTWTHKAFDDPKQRIYMSATLGAGGDLERLMGRRKIKRLQVPDGWDRHGVGRRFFIFPSMSLDENNESTLCIELMRYAGRSLVLAPSQRVQDKITKHVASNLGYSIFSAEDIEQSKKPFISEDKAIAVVANRYDGIDFPGKECRLLFVDGLPKAMNIQERFLMSRMGATVLFNGRIQTRVLQAVGRCTRSLEDYSAVVVSGDELPDYLSDKRRRKYLHPELQAEIKFGIEQSTSVSIPDIIDNFNIFIENGEGWEEVNQQIVAYRKEAQQEQFPALEELNVAVEHEIRYQEKLWQGDYETALSHAEAVLAELTDTELKGYRALWHYIAGSAAFLGAEEGIAGLSTKAKIHFSKAKNAAGGIPWLVNLARYQESKTADKRTDTSVMAQIERLEAVLSNLGKVHERKFAAREKEILEGLASEKSFENAHKLLGEMLGFISGKIESKGSPDPWWHSENICFVFEDHAGASSNSLLDVTKARQVSSHPNWIRENIEITKDTEILPVLVTPVTKSEKEARPHLGNVSIWPLDEFREWANTALATVREVRKTFSEVGDLAWRTEAADAFERNGLNAENLHSMLSKRKANEHLNFV